MDQRRLRCPCSSRRFLAQSSQGYPLGPPRRLHVQPSGRQYWFPGRANARTLSLQLFIGWYRESAVGDENLSLLNGFQDISDSPVGTIPAAHESLPGTSRPNGNVNSHVDFGDKRTSACVVADLIRLAVSDYAHSSLFRRRRHLCSRLARHRLPATGVARFPSC